MTDPGFDAHDVVQEERQRILTIEPLLRCLRVLFEDVCLGISVERQEARAFDARHTIALAPAFPTELYADD